MIHRENRRRAIAVGVAVLAAVGLCATGATAASAATAQGSTTFPGSVPAWATAAADQGPAAADTSVEGEVYLPLRDQQGAEQLATAASTPGARGYRQFLSPAQWIGRFSPTQSDYNLMLSFLKGKGLTITATPKSRLFIVFRGTAAQVGGVFSAQLHSYAHDGQSLIAPSSAPSVPAEFAGKVSGVGLDQAKLLTHPTSLRPDQIDGATASSALQRKSAAAPPTVTAPCSNYYGEKTAVFPAAYGTTKFPTNICGYTPAQLRSAYGIQSLTAQGLTGKGQTVAITDAYASPSIVQDVNTYSAKLGEPGLAPGQYRQIVPKPSQFLDKALCQNPSGWQGEQTLDVQAVHGIAPGANILYVGGFNCGGGLDSALATILDGKLADLVSNSWGNVGEDLPIDVLQGQSHLFLQAAGEGIGMYFSSGDNGDEAAALDGKPAPDFPGSSPYVTSVGGTSMGIDKGGRLVLETGWGTAGDKVNPAGTGYVDPLPGEFFGGAGGGVSTFFGEPAYQKGVVPDALAKGHRVSPDVAALADPYTGFLIGLSPIVDETTLATDPFETEAIGGTSLASPLTAAQVALVQQATHSSIGFANPTLYAVAKAAPSAFRDVVPSGTHALAYQSLTSGNRYLITLDKDTSLKTARGYDDVTGIGGISFALLSRVARGGH